MANVTEEEIPQRAASAMVKFATQYAWWCILLVTLLTAGAAVSLVNPITGELRLDVDPSLDRLLPKNDEDLRFYQENRHIFGGDDAVVVALRPHTDAGEIANILEADALSRIQDMAEQMAEIHGVHSVVSIATAPAIQVSQEEITFGNVLDQLKETDFSLESRQSILLNDLYRNTLVTADGQVGTILVGLRDLGDRALLESNLVPEIRRIVNEQDAHFETWITGGLIVKAATAEALFTELTKALPLIGLILAALLLVAFRSLRATVLPLVTIMISLAWTLATMVILHRPLNMVTVIIPPVIITLGLAYCMHVITEYYESFRHYEPGSVHPSKRLSWVLDKISLPLVITGVTTAAGFLALLLNPLAAVKEFAFFATLGVCYTIGLALTLLPAMLTVAGKAKKVSMPTGSRLFAWTANVLARYNLKFRPLILVLGFSTLAVALYGASRIEVGSTYISDFPETSELRQDYEFINTTLGGANPFFIVVEGYVKDTFVQPEALTDIQSLQNWLEEQPEVADTHSLVDMLLQINQNLNAGDSDSYTIPSEARTIKQLFLFGGGDELRSFVDAEYHTIKIAVRANVEDTASINALLKRVETRLKRLPPPMVGRATGSSVLATRTVDDIAGGQLISFGLALVVIWIILTLLFTSRRVGFMALMPNVIPIAIYFGALGLSGITLNPTTSLIACIVLGIAVDDTIHYLVRFNAEAKKAASEEKANYATLNGVIRPITFTSIALVLGFLVMTDSQLQNQVEFGALAAFTLAMAWVTDVTFTPAMASKLKIVTLWDVLRLDLGHDPQRSIPLLQGLSLRQARRFALMSNFTSHRAGSRIIEKGRDATNIYVLIDGTLEVWVSNDKGERISLNTLRRGAVLGEVGSFNKKRTANVDAMTRVRVLKFNTQDLETLRKRHPRIAAIIYRNLNQTQAARIAELTDRVQQA
ncbi:MAG: efflux RND transporter permease subunit [Gammaproteobacteria bacterium]|nr:efflux RND transporter permease subunit [Gammaproteobacteria bacterium]